MEVLFRHPNKTLKTAACLMLELAGLTEKLNTHTHTEKKGGVSLHLNFTFST